MLMMLHLLWHIRLGHIRAKDVARQKVDAVVRWWTPIKGSTSSEGTDHLMVTHTGDTLMIYSDLSHQYVLQCVANSIYRQLC
jgi:hypothetical protein